MIRAIAAPLALLVLATLPVHAQDAELLDKARAGDAAAQFALGAAYAAGRDAPRDPTEALYWYLKAAEAGHVDALNNLGVLHERGIDGVPDLFEAERWYRRGARAGSADAQFNLALLLDTRARDADPLEAVRFYRMAAEQGLASAQNNLARLLLTDVDGAPRPGEAARWAAAAVAQGHPLAHVHLDTALEQLPRVRIRAQGANLREGPGLQNASLAKLDRGTAAYVLDQPVAGWLELYVPIIKTVGAISADLTERLAAPAPTPARTPMRANASCTIECDESVCWKSYPDGRQVRVPAQDRAPRC